MKIELLANFDSFVGKFLIFITRLFVSIVQYQFVHGLKGSFTSLSI